MEATLEQEANASVNAKPLENRFQMPVSFMKAGETAQVIKVRGNDEMHHHLENLGFVDGAEFRVVNEQAGNVIIEIKGAQIALDKNSASKIIAA